MCQAYGHGERIFDVAFHPLNDDIVLTASEDTSVRMWRREEGSTMYKQARAFLGHAGEVLRVAWSANGLLLASGSADRTVRLWAADLYDQGYTGRQLAVLDGHPEEVYHVELVDPSTPYQLPAARQPTPPSAAAGGGSGGAGAGGAATASFESHVLAASSESLFVWSLQEGCVVQQADAPGTSGSTITQADIMGGARPAYVFGVARQPGGSLVATACCDGAVRLWSMRPTGHLDWAGQVALPEQPMCVGCAFTADGARLGVVTRQGRLVELDVRTMETLTSRQLPSSPLTVSYMPAGASAAAPAPAGGPRRELWLVPCRDGAVYGYELERRGDEPSVVLQPPSAPGTAMLAVAVAPGASALAVAGEPQDASLLPPMRQQPASIHKAATAPPTAAAAAATSGNGAAAANGSGGASSRGGSAPAGGGGPLAAPPRRRGGGSRPSRVVAGGLGAQDPLALFEEAEGLERQQAAQSAIPSEGDPVSSGIAAMSLGEGQSGSSQGAQGPQGPSSGGKATAGVGGVGGAAQAEAGGEAAGRGPHGGAGDREEEGEAAPPARMRAALFVYRAAT
ncbi:hypothetical protein GPECTOR_16g748 [Gonium pectorale]|uniref:Uncharacterized protein n=1 Tax=Gonium pectorale TaxID=33097 RepID=A0A150GL77_GONPE|nr:hypothetical protein GPECTOR_16g748 [Gonium pectorale]|eukprot:KXZ50573.1 hypothetical protein GPECTOR_16g748 [Gonium pectorale]